MNQEAQNNAAKEFLSTMVELATEAGNTFRAKQGREPTEAEASRMADMITNQARTAVTMMRGAQ